MRERKIKRTGVENIGKNFLERNYGEKNYGEKNFNYGEKNFLNNKKNFSGEEKFYSEKNNYLNKNPLERTSEKFSQVASGGQKIFSRFGNYLQEEGFYGVKNDVVDFGKNLANSLIDGAKEGGADVLDFENNLNNGRFTKYLPQKDMIAQAYGTAKFTEGLVKRAVEYGGELGTGVLEIGTKGIKEGLDIFGKKNGDIYRTLDKFDNYLDLGQAENKKFLAREGMEKSGSFISDLGFAGGITNKISGRLNLSKGLEKDALNFANELKAGAIEGTISGTTGAMTDDISDPGEFVKRIGLEAGLGVVADVSFKGIGELYSSGKPYVEETIKTLKKTGISEKEIVKFLGELDKNRKLFLEGYNKKSNSVILGSGPAEFFDRSTEGVKNILENNLENFSKQNKKFSVDKKIEIMKKI